MTVIGAGGSSILAAYVNCMLPSNVNFFVSCLEIDQNQPNLMKSNNSLETDFGLFFLEISELGKKTTKRG